MPIIPAFAQPNGNQNMTLFGERNDDTTVNLPQMEFSFFYNKQSVNVLYSSGNSWLGFGSGTACIITQSSYLPCIVKILAEDSDGIKSYDSENSLWAVVGEPPLTEEMFLQFGMDSLPNSVDGLRNAATLHYYTDDPLVLAETQNYKLHIWEIVTSKPKTIIQIEDFLIPQGKLIEKIEMRTNITGGKIRMALSVDGGTVWLTFTDGSFVPLDISNTATFLANGISPDGAALLDMAALNGIINGTLRLAYILEKPKLTDICKLKAVKITYVQ